MAELASRSLRIFGCSTQQQAVDRLHGVLARVEEEMAVGVV